MPGKRWVDQVRRQNRLRQVEQFLLSGLNRTEMADRLGVTTRTIDRDLEYRRKTLNEEIGDEIVAYRSAILSDLGKVLTELVEDVKSARDAGKHTHAYHDVRVNALRLIARITGAEQPSVQFHKHAHIHLGSGKSEDVSVGEIRIVEGEAAYPIDDSDTRYVVETPRDDEPQD